MKVAAHIMMLKIHTRGHRCVCVYVCERERGGEREREDVKTSCVFFPRFLLSTCYSRVHACVYMCAYVCMHVCVRERDREDANTCVYIYTRTAYLVLLFSSVLPRDRSLVRSLSRARARARTAHAHDCSFSLARSCIRSLSPTPSPFFFFFFSLYCFFS